ncbi:MAG: hypothetical protein P8Y67_12185 [Alphaproteobacteria bacterium]
MDLASAIGRVDGGVVMALLKTLKVDNLTRLRLRPTSRVAAAPITGS